MLRNLGFDVPSPILYYYDWPGMYKPFKAQEVTSDFLTSHNRAFCLNDLGCVDADTEYLSPTGWKRIADYAGGPVAQYWPETGAVDFVESAKYVKLPCDTMFEVKTKYGIDQLLSPEHRMLITDRSGAKRETVQAWELHARQEQWVDTGKNKKSLTKIGYGKASIPVVYLPPGGPGVPLSDEALRVQIAVIADGNFPNNTNRCVVRLKKDRKKTRLRAILSAANINYTENNNTAAEGFSVFSFQAPVRTKEFGDQFWAATPAQLAVVRDEVLHWDGSIRTGKPTTEFISNAKTSADFVQYAFNAGGFVARITVDPRGPTYSVVIRNNGRPLQLAGSGAAGRLRSIQITLSTDGFKYCFMVPSSYLILRRNGCVFASGNTGKSLSTLWAYDYLRSKSLAGKALIVSPLSTLERTWADELFRHFPHLTYAVLHGSRQKRLKLLEQDVDIYIINHDGVEIVAEAMKHRLDITHVIVDEIAQVARNAGTDRWKALNIVINKQVPRQAWGLTGTPTPNQPTDAWAQCRLLVPENVPPYFNRFKDMVLRQVGPFTWLPRDNATEVVKQAMQPAIRFSRDECVDLPPCLYETREVQLTPEQEKAYASMMSKLVAEVGAGEILAVNEAVKMSKLLQIGCGVAYDTNGGEVSIPSKNRLQAVLDIIEDTPYKVIVFVPFVSAVNKVADFLTSKHVAVECIHGGVSKADRDRIFSDFQKREDPRVLVAQPAAMSHGLTLTAASTIVWFAPTTSNETFEQANGRISRPGQKNNQFIIMLEGTAVERRLYERLKNKQKAQGLLLTMVKEDRR